MAVNIYPKFTESELKALGLIDASLASMPKNVGIIMDGNGRWAKKRLLPRSAGHRAGMEALRKVVRFSHSVGLEVLTVYAFSTENWNRPRTEVDALFSLLVEYFYKEIDELDANGVQIRIIGDVSAFSPKISELINTAVSRTAGNKGLIFNVALNYGGRAELVRAAKQLVLKGIDAEAIDEACLSSELYTAGQSEVDLIIRTAGEQRLSNFLLWQAAYAEFVFTDVLFPDFDQEAFSDCLREYMRRIRRFGKVL